VERGGEVKGTQGRRREGEGHKHELRRGIENGPKEGMKGNVPWGSAQRQMNVWEWERRKETIEEKRKKSQFRPIRKKCRKGGRMPLALASSLLRSPPF
jgi:hypothetical protein